VSPYKPFEPIAHTVENPAPTPEERRRQQEAETVELAIEHYEGVEARGSAPRNTHTVLQEAGHLVDGDRQEAYGSPRANHGRTSELWSAYLGVPISHRQVCHLNALQKISRDAHRPKRDNLVDICGYMRNAELLEEA
jgi:hypothetical protein